MNLEHANAEIFTALAAAQGDVENATKGSQNPHFKSWYADLATILNTVRPAFSKHGLSILQSTAFDGAMVSVTTTLAHASGAYVSGTASCVPPKSDAQGIGAATTYLRRYGLAAMCGVAQEDDDGNSAAHDGRPALKISPADGARESLSEARQDDIDRYAIRMVEYWDEGDVAAAYDYVIGLGLTTEERVALNSQLDSKFRAALKKHHYALPKKDAA